jgi:F-box/leucine-rich repeat protein 5
MRKTDFTSNVALQALLRHLHDIFFEVKCHEDIEDNIILDKLQARLKSHCIDNAAVCDCHSDIRVGQVSSVVLKCIGLMCVILIL